MKEVLKEFDKYLAKNKKSFKATVIGGAALIVMDVITRKTKDIDLIDPEIPQDIKDLSVNFSKDFPEFFLDFNWFNNGPISIVNDLPVGWRNRTQQIFSGESIQLLTLGRLDLLKTKLFAYCDRESDFEDCLKLKPTVSELDLCFEWVSQRDANEMWSDHVKENFEVLRDELRKR